MAASKSIKDRAGVMKENGSGVLLNLAIKLRIYNNVVLEKWVSEASFFFCGDDTQKNSL